MRSVEAGAVTKPSPSAVAAAAAQHLETLSCDRRLHPSIIDTLSAAPGACMTVAITGAAVVVAAAAEASRALFAPVCRIPACCGSLAGDSEQGGDVDNEPE
jgi:hypothetical protein